MSDSGQMSGTVQIETCDKHGIRYNALTHDGCVRCRRESGETVGPSADAQAATPATAGLPGARHSPNAKRPDRPTDLSKVVPGIALALVMILATGQAFYRAHRFAYDGFREKLEAESPGLFDQLVTEVGVEPTPEELDPNESSDFEEMMEELREEEENSDDYYGYDDESGGQ